jgi:hypothetical protein
MDTDTAGSTDTAPPPFLDMAATLRDSTPGPLMAITFHPRYRSLLGHKAPSQRRSATDAPAVRV